MSILEIGTSGLLANQRALDTIANNIANASNPDYNRQETIQASRTPINMGYGFVGTGVDIVSVKRSVDTFLVDSMRVQQSSFSQIDTYSRITSQIATLLADSSIGISDSLNSFFSSLQELSNDPASVPARQLLISNAQVLEDRFNGLAGQVTQETVNVNNEMTQIVADINRIAGNIADTNTRIIGLSGSTDSTPNDLLDERDALILELSKYVEVSTNTQEDGSINIFVGNGQTLVIGSNVNNLTIRPDPLDASNIDIAISAGAGSQPITNNISGGELGGLLQVRETILEKTQNSLGLIATTVAATLNDQHKLGIDLNGELGADLFNDVNDFKAQFDRVSASTANIGSGIFRASIDTITRPNVDAVQVYSDSTNIVDTGTLTPLTTGLLTINGVNIRPTIPADDVFSSSDNTASAIAIANAVNASSTQHGVVAAPQTNTLALGQFTAGAFAAGEFQVNGVNIVTAGTDTSILVQDINAVSTQTGVIARNDGNGNVTLYAEDGRNIQLTSNTNTPAATFTHFDTNSAVALDKVQRSGVQLTTTRDNIAIAGSASSSLGFTPGTSPEQRASLIASDYELAFDGASYRLTRLSDNVLVATSASPNISADGFTLTLESGSVMAGDIFYIKPVKNGANNFSFNISDPLKIAMASPVTVSSSLNNAGNGAIKLDSVLNTSGTPAATSGTYGNAFANPGELTPPLRIEFISATKFRIMDISNGGAGVQVGPEQSYNANQSSTPIFPMSGVVDKSLPGPNQPYTFDPGYRISLQGTMQAGDTFEVGYNINGEGDNRNGVELIELQLDKLMSGGSATFQDTYVQIIGEVGTKAAQAKVNTEASETLLSSIKERKSEVSGVNIDEEATNLIKFQQAYQAAAQIIVVARSTFDTMIRAFGG